MGNEIIYKVGDRVRFAPKHRKYDEGTMSHVNNIGHVIDSSDLPNVRMDIPVTSGLMKILTADQRDLVLAEGGEALCP